MQEGFLEAEGNRGRGRGWIVCIVSGCGGDIAAVVKRVDEGQGGGCWVRTRVCFLSLEDWKICCCAVGVRMVAKGGVVGWCGGSGTAREGD